MKYLLSILTFLVFSAPQAFSQDYDNPVEYMSVISKQNENISKKFMSYVSASAHGKGARKVENLRAKLLNEVQEARMNIASMPSCKGDKGYRDTAVNFMKLYFNVLNEDYSKIINMEDVAEQSYDNMEAYLMAKELVDEKLEEGNVKMKQAQRSFAARNNINLTESSTELGDMMKQIHAVNIYYKQIYLIFFRPYKQDVYLMEAVQKNNITGIEQNKNALSKYADEGLQKLGTFPAYEGDNSIVEACRKMLNFYTEEVKGPVNTISEFYLVKERFETIKKEFEKKSDPSKEEIEKYNDGVNDINKASDAFNASANALNNQRNDALKSWTKAVNNFFDEHTPHYR